MSTLEQIRKSRRMSRPKLAELSGVGLTTIQRIERPEWARKTHNYSRMDIDTAEKIARAFGLRTEDIEWPLEVTPISVNVISVSGQRSRTHVHPHAREKTCPSCFIVLPSTGVCDDCN